jgi:CheY-like chemotaxis protein
MNKPQNGTAAAPKLARPRALIVEDEPTITLYLAACLEELGYEVASTGSALAALAVARKTGNFCVAFIDLGLPDSSGLELISTLQALRPDIRVVIASGYGEMALRDSDSWGIPVIVLSKPFDRAKVADALRQLGLAVLEGGDPAARE